LGVDSRALNDAQQVRKIVAVAVGAFARSEIHLPHPHELILEQQLGGDVAEWAIVLRHAGPPRLGEFASVIEPMCRLTLAVSRSAPLACCARFFLPLLLPTRATPI